MTLVRTLLRVIAVAVCVAVAVPASALAADPAPSRLGLSSTEQGPWSTSLGAPLFDPSVRWVPGDSVTTGFWARNQSTDSTEFRITLLPQARSLMDSGDFDVRIRAGEDDRWQPVRSAWTAPRPLAAGEKMNIQIRATLHETADNAAQTLEFAFDIRTRLTYQGPVVAPSPRPTPQPTTSATPAPPSGGAGAADGSRPSDDEAASAEEDRVAAPTHGALAGTGADQPAWLVPLGAGALITGLWMALVARHRREKKETFDE